MVSVSAVCFCDIPLRDLGVHMGKYGQFGLAFPKPFLIAQGASPVFYVAQNAAAVVQGGTRGKYFNRMSQIYSPIRAFLFSHGGGQGMEDLDLQELLEKYPTLRSDEAVRRLANNLDLLTAFFDRDILGYVKCFDASLSDADEHNYYLEREWRVATDVAFELRDIAFVIVPEAYRVQCQNEFAAISPEKILSAEACHRHL
ncbi:MAG: abortive infection system antitoxin AbiGi family protein [Candidatus Polarisedimenticolia bacterium]